MIHNSLPKRAPPEYIDILVMPGVHLLDLAAPVQVFGNPELQLSLKYISTSAGVISAQGLSINNLESLPQQRLGNRWLLIIGTNFSAQRLQRQAHIDAARWLAKYARDYAFWAGICSGSLLAAKAGLLDGRRCTTHHDLIDDLQRLAPRALVQEDCLFVEDSDCITSAGIATGIDMSLHLVSQAWGHQCATRIARESVLYLRRSGDDSQHSFWLNHRNHIQSRIHNVQDAIMENPGKPWSTEQLAGIACLSERHLRRLFSSTTSVKLSEYLSQARLTLAKQLLRDTNLGLDEVASRSGFGTERSLRRVWQQHRVGTPAEYRRQG
ncbi:MAG: helix-turn-helix domain-containing protein [Granulosicoccus sp.]